MLFLLTDFPRKLKLEKFHGALITHFYVSQSSPPPQSRFKENAKIFAPSPKKILQLQDRIYFCFY